MDDDVMAPMKTAVDSSDDRIQKKLYSTKNNNFNVVLDEFKESTIYK